jgi:hypothetical protein
MILSDRCAQRGKYSTADCLLLAAQMIFEQFVARNIARIHSGEGIGVNS